VHVTWSTLPKRTLHIIEVLHEVMDFIILKSICSFFFLNVWIITSKMTETTRNVFSEIINCKEALMIKL
jgi:hypothetical protein